MPQDEVAGRPRVRAAARGSGVAALEELAVQLSRRRAVRHILPAAAHPITLRKPR